MTNSFKVLNTPDLFNSYYKDAGETEFLIPFS